MPISAILESAVVLPSIKPNSCDCLKMKENIHGFHLRSGYSHKNLFLTALYICILSPKLIMHYLFMYPCMFLKVIQKWTL